MGGQVLELYSERLMREGQELGRTEGRELGRAEVVHQLCASGLLTPEQIAGVVGMTPEEVRALQER